MTSVTVSIDFNAGPQAGGRLPAPGELGLVQAFVNTHYDLEHEHGAEVLHSPRALADWLAARGLLEGRASLSRADLRRAHNVREGLRALLAVNNGADPDPRALERLNRAASRPGLVIQLRADASPSFQPAGRDLDGAIALLLAIVARSRLEGTWERFKACPGADCGWAFYDYSRNQAGAWCSMAICGSRAKARAYRMRHRRMRSRR
jgi:predicted RNA-binding Zn ribbon-like protein